MSHPPPAACLGMVSQWEFDWPRPNWQREQSWSASPPRPVCLLVVHARSEVACCYRAGRDALRENRAPTHRLTAPRRSEAGAPLCRRTPPPPGCRAVKDSTLVTWYPCVYAPRTGGAYDSHHRTAGIAGRTRRRGFLVFFCVSAAAQEGYDGAGPDKWHQGFYSQLRRNDGGSCCNLMDCRPTQSRIIGDHYEVKVDGVWTPVPYDKINNVVAPDGGAHVCAPRQVGPNKGVIFCV